ncbi:GNAT family N-acetyltransferase [Kutzneria kofuensis]|uniref:GNAT family N-acetyltransferase n=1 Tax=Kutzneria kofuensis TaxID=103725 RepID=UPI0031E799E4
MLLRESRESDRDRAHRAPDRPGGRRPHRGGPNPREAVERRIDEIGIAGLTDAPGVFVIADRATDAFIGTVQLTAVDADQPGHLADNTEELELVTCCTVTPGAPDWPSRPPPAVLRAAAAELPDQPVILRTQTANTRSQRLAARLGFQPVRTFECSTPSRPCVRRRPALLQGLNARNGPFLNSELRNGPFRAVGA